MEITINLPETTLKKVRAFGILCRGQASDLESALIDLVDIAVSKAIIESVSEPQKATEVSFIQDRRKPTPRGQYRAASYEEEIGISAELGDDEDTIEDAESDEAAFVPAKGGLTENELESDMDIEDPEHEVKVSAPPAKSVKNTVAEEIFSELSGLPSVPNERVERRKKKVNSKGRVISFTGVEGRDS